MPQVWRIAHRAEGQPKLDRCQVLLDGLPQGLFATGADDALDWLSANEDDEGWDSQDAETGGNVWAVVDVQAREKCPPGEFRAQPVEYGSHLTARTAPRGPEVYDGRLQAGKDHSLEIVGGNADGPAVGTWGFIHVEDDDWGHFKHSA